METDRKEPESALTAVGAIGRQLRPFPRSPMKLEEDEKGPK